MTDFEEQYEKLLKYCYARLKNKELAEDTVQETFLRFLSAKDYRDMDRELPYLYTIARNLITDHFRKSREEPVPDEAFFDELPDENADTEKHCIDRIVVENALAKLTAEEREAAELCYIAGLSRTEAGKVLGISRFAVARRLGSAKKILKKELEGTCS